MTTLAEMLAMVFTAEELAALTGATDTPKANMPLAFRIALLSVITEAMEAPSVEAVFALEDKLVAIHDNPEANAHSFLFGCKAVKAVGETLSILALLRFGQEEYDAYAKSIGL